MATSSGAAAPEAGIHRVVTLETPVMPPLLECIGSTEALQEAAPSEAAADDDASCLPVQSGSRRTVQLCTYNIFEGLNRLEPSRVENLKKWLRAENLDLVALNEANHLDEATLAALGAAVGLNHSALHVASTGFHLGVLSSHPLTVHPTAHLKMWHGLLHVDMQGLHLLITHLTPYDIALRHAEVEVILTYANDMLKRGLPVLLMGDLNALSPLDQSTHNHHELCTTVLCREHKLQRKFLTPERAIDYTTLQLLLEAGFHDAGAAVANSTSVPTAVGTDAMHAAAMRLDYILMSPGVKALLAETAAVYTIRDQLTEHISDHLPVRVELNLG